MKGIDFFSIALLGGMFLFSSCDKDDDGIGFKGMSKEMHEEFDKLYPGAKVIDCDKEFNGLEVEFVYDDLKHEALFSLDNKWVYTKIDYNRDVSRLPETAKQYIDTRYPDGYHEIDVEFYDCAESSKNYYNVEVEDRADRDYEYNFDMNGGLLDKNHLPNF